jgi:hypothetical protein
MTNGFKEAINKTKTKASKTKKKTMASLDAPENIQKLVDKYSDAKASMKTAKGSMDVYGSQIVEWGIDQQDKLAYGGDYKTSFSIHGEKSKITFVGGNRFSINPDDIPEIESILGGRFDNLIDVKHDVRLRPEVFTNSKLQDALMNLIGDNFEKFFITEVSASVKDGYDKAIYTAVDEEGLEKIRNYVKPYKPSLK